MANLEFKHKSFEYAKRVINGDISAPKYVKKQCEEFIKICEGKDDKYFLDTEKLKNIDNILKLLIMPRGLKVGESIYDCSCGCQFLLYTSVLCIVYRENHQKRCVMKRQSWKSGERISRRLQ